ncbi:MAG: HEAT repeat domain-containing protein [Planctomycetota bacterium]|nr:HEAT repeat domain-containing protein [Planctomycetota bacterium]
MFILNGLFVLLFVLPFWTDIVVLVNGGKVTGRIIENSEKRVVVEVRWGTVEVRKEDVKLVIVTGVDEMEEELKEEEAKRAKQEKTVVQQNPPTEPKEEPTGEQKKEEPKEEKAEKEEVKKKENEKPLTEEEKKQLETFITQIGHPEANIRRMGRLSLMNFGKRVVPRLIQALSDNNFWRRMNACDLLREMGDKRALKPLVSRLKDENLYVRIAADNALKKLTGKDVSFNPQNPSEESVNEWKKIVDEMTKEEEEEGDK